MEVTVEVVGVTVVVLPPAEEVPIELTLSGSISRPIKPKSCPADTTPARATAVGRTARNFMIIVLQVCFDER